MILNLSKIADLTWVWAIYVYDMIIYIRKQEGISWQETKQTRERISCDDQITLVYLACNACYQMAYL